MIRALPDIAWVLLLTAWAGCMGRLIVRRLTTLPEARADRWSLCTLTGLGCLGLLLMALGLLRWLQPFAIGCVFAAGGCAVLADWVFDRIGPRRAVRMPQEPVTSPHRRGALDWVIEALIAIGAAATFLAALPPVTDGDALCYHLQVPKVFLAAGAAVYEPDLHETIYPLLTEMLFTAALLIRGPVACRLICWVFGLLFAGCVTALARPVLGGRARWAGGLALLAPAISNGMTAPLNDVALAAFCAGALLAWMQWRAQPTLGNAVFTGLMCGLAIGVKYPALVWVACLFIASLWGRPKRSQLTAFVLVCVAVGSIWYLRAYACTGNPVFPFFKSIFGGAGLDVVLEPAKRPLPVNAWNLLIALWPVTLDPDRFDSVSHQFGPLFLMTLPALLAFRAPRRVWMLAAFGFAYFTLCMTQRQSMRFVLAALGPWSVAAAWVTIELVRRRQRLALSLLLLLLATQAAIAVVRVRNAASVVLGRETDVAFLSRGEPTFALGLWIDANLPKTSRIIGQDHRGFYIPRPYTMELAHRRRTGLGSSGESAGDLAATMRARGFTHLLLCPPLPRDAVEFDATLNERLAAWTASRSPLYQRELQDHDGVKRRYAIYSLDEPGKFASRSRIRQ